MKNAPLYLTCLALFYSTLLVGQSFPPPKPITNEEQIRLVLVDLEQGIRSQEMVRVLDCFHASVQEGDRVVSRAKIGERIQRAFDRSAKRWDDSLFQALTPVSSTLTGTWDFELEIDTLRILNDGTARAKVWIYFGASPADVKSRWKFGKKHLETLVFRRVNGEWRVKQIKRLLNVLSKYGEI